MRRAVVFNRTRPDVIVAAVTSRLEARLADDEYLLSDREQRLAGLPKPSKVKAGKIVTIDQRLVRRTLGVLPPAARRRLRTLVHKIL